MHNIGIAELFGLHKCGEAHFFACLLVRAWGPADVERVETPLSLFDFLENIIIIFLPFFSLFLRRGWFFETVKGLMWLVSTT